MLNYNLDVKDEHDYDDSMIVFETDCCGKGEIKNGKNISVRKH